MPPPALPSTSSPFTKLQSLEFRHVISHLPLRNLLAGPTKIPNLNRLVIQPPEYRVGYSHDDDDIPDYYYDEDFPGAKVKGWVPPEWEGMDYVDAREIVDLARAEGVTIDSDWEKAVIASEGYMDEVAWCEDFNFHS